MPSTVSIQIDTSAKTKCKQFTAVPVSNSIHVTVIADKQSKQSAAEDLYDSICDSVRSLDSSVREEDCATPGSSPLSRFLNCKIRRWPDSHSVLIPVTEDLQVTPQTQNLIREWIRPDPVRNRVIPVLPEGASPETVLPSPLDRIGVLFDDANTIKEKAPEVMTALRISALDERVFLSYARNDTQEIATQLFERLSHEGFDVYLDTASGTPGRPFPDEIRENLAQKAVVLLLELPKVMNSQWTKAEIAYATKQSLGLMALHTGVSGTPYFVQVHRRKSVSRIDLENYGGGSPLKRARLSESYLEEFIQWFRRYYPTESVYRRTYMESRMNTTLGSASTIDAQSVYHVQSSHTQSTAVHLTPRPPVLQDAQRVKQAASPSERTVLVGPHSEQSPENEESLHWLAGELDVCLYPDTRWKQLAHELRQSQLTLCR